LPDISIVNATIQGQPNCVPTGPLMIVAVLEQAGYDVEFLDYQTYSALRKPSVDTFSEFLRTASGSIIGISVLAGNLPTVLGAVQRLKKAQPRKTVILGGPAASDSAQGILEAFPVDIVVRGEGEATVVELVRGLEDGIDLKDVAGITYRDGGDIVSTPNRARIQDLDSLPFPAYHRIDFADYGAGLHLMTSRGCPYECGFCSTHSTWERTVTYRSIESVVREVASVKDMIRMLTFCDDNPALRAERVFELCRCLQEENIRLPWSSYGRVDHMGEEMIRTMAAHGCVEVFYGVESGSDAVLSRLNKRFRFEEAQACLKMSARHIGQVNASFIWGFPYESLEDFYDTLMAVGEVERTKGVTPYLYLLGPLPKTPLYREFGHLTRFSEDFYPHVTTIPVRERLADFPEVVELVIRHPSLFTGFYHYDHPELPTKRKLLESLGLRKKANQAPTADGAP
jgi:anaerobic magnesium-protoporphyrin IX monomethyl ester cyclase